MGLKALLYYLERDPTFFRDQIHINGQHLQELVEGFRARQNFIERMSRCKPHHFGSPEAWIAFFKKESEEFLLIR